MNIFWNRDGLTPVSSRTIGDYRITVLSLPEYVFALRQTILNDPNSPVIGISI